MLKVDEAVSVVEEVVSREEVEAEGVVALLLDNTAIIAIIDKVRASPTKTNVVVRREMY
jgi:hypothetical protein